MNSYQQRFYDLYQFLAGYFHQGWNVVFEWRGAEPTFEAVVRHYKAVGITSEVAQTIQELEQFLALPLNEEQLSDALDDMSCVYYPPGDGQTYRAWLEAVLAVLREPQEKARELRYVEGMDTGEWKQHVDEETNRMLNIK